MNKLMYVIIMCVGMMQVTFAQDYFYPLANFPAHHINCMVVDEQQVKWLGTEQGLIRLVDEQTITLFNEQNSAIRDAHINCLQLDQVGTKWMGSYSKGLMSLNATGTFVHYPFANDKILLITDIAIKADGQVVVATSTDGIYQLKEGKLHPLWRVKNSRLPSNRVEMIKVAENNSLLIGTTKGLCEVTKGRWKLFPKLENVKDVQQMGDWWYASAISTDGPKLWRKTDRKWEIVPATIFNPDFQIKEIILGNRYLWLTSARGLIRFDGRAHRVFDKRYGLSHAISCVVVDRDSILWIGTTNKGVYTQGEKPKKQVIKQPTLADNGLQVGVLMSLQTATFQRGTAILVNLDIVEELQILIAFLHEHPAAIIAIHGHTDNTGSQLKNWELSKQRVITITQLLVENGIDETRIKGFWHGENKPLVPNNSEANKVQNRRVEIQIILNP